jgi:hypothetical protein
MGGISRLPRNSGPAAGSILALLACISMTDGTASAAPTPEQTLDLSARVTRANTLAHRIGQEQLRKRLQNRSVVAWQN